MAEFETEAGFKGGKYVKPGSVRPLSPGGNPVPENADPTGKGESVDSFDETTSETKLKAEIKRRGLELVEGATKADMLAALKA